jgi:hypothetical protein
LAFVSFSCNMGHQYSGDDQLCKLKPIVYAIYYWGL